MGTNPVFLWQACREVPKATFKIGSVISTHNCGSSLELSSFFYAGITHRSVLSGLKNRFTDWTLTSVSYCSRPNYKEIQLLENRI